MPQRWTFDAAANFWRQHANADPESVWDRFIAAEAFILDHAPGTPAEAELLFEVLLEQGLDARGDGRDRKALERLQTFVRGLPSTASVAA